MKNTTHKISSKTIKERYQRAKDLEKGIFTNKVAVNTTLFPVWIGSSDYFWYERALGVEKNALDPCGKEYRLVNSISATNNIAFDHELLASSLARASSERVEPKFLPVRAVDMKLSKSGLVEMIYFSAFNKRWQFTEASGACTQVQDYRSNDEVVSPDGKYLAFSRDNNIWLRTLENKEEKQLTFDGEEHFVYGGPGTAWAQTMGCGLQALWSPDSRKIFTVQRDTRQVKDFPVVYHVPIDGSMRPKVINHRFAYPGDEHVETLRLLSIDIHTATLKSVNYSQVPVTRNNFGFFTANLGWWNNDSRRAYFVDVDRYYKYARVIEFDTETGKTRILFEEVSESHINLMLNIDELPTFMPLPKSNELVWYSERTGWAHLYLYDLETGRLKNAITRGDWLVRNLIQFDPKRRELFVQTAGRNPDIDPYYRDLVRVNIDTGNMTKLVDGEYEYVAVVYKDLLTMSSGCHHASNAVSETGNFAVVTRSRADEVPISLLVDRHGQEIMTLEIADVSGLPEGWEWPQPVKLLAEDKVTDIYGLVYRPSNFSPDHLYPIISYVFNTPELTTVSKGSFTNESSYGWFYLDAAALAELGFIVVQIDGRGTPFRDKAFHDDCYGWVESASRLEDHISGIRQLAERYSYMDINRVGITTHASGGPGALQGLLQYPDFFKVGIANQLHDSRLTSSSMWGDKYEGPDGPKSEAQFPEQYADQLQAPLLLMGGMLDTSAPPAATFRVIEALQKANKDFDLILLPNLGHRASNYLIRRTWDYLVHHLLEEKAPREFDLSGGFGVD